MGRILRHKKGGIIDIALVIVVLFIVAIGSLIAYKLLFSINEHMQDSNIIVDEQKQAVQNATDLFPNLFDYVFLIIFVILFLAVVVSAAMLPSAPMYFFISCFAMVFLLVLTAALGNAFYDASTVNLASERAAFTIIPFVMDNFVLMIAVLFFAMVIAFYAVSQGGGP